MAPPFAENPPITQADIARALGVAVSTVSRALKNDPTIPEKRRQSIQTMAEKMGYRPNSLAATLAHWKWNIPRSVVHSSLAWLNLWPNPNWPRGVGEFSKYYEGASEAAKMMGYRLEEFVLNERMSPARLEKVLVTRGITGVFIPPQRYSPDWSGFHWDNFSIVRFGRSCATPLSHLVAGDQVSTTKHAFQKIEARGYLRIGFVTGGWAIRRGALVKAGALLHQSELPKNRQIPSLVFEETNAPWEQRYPRYVTALAHWMGKNKPDAIFTDVGELRRMLSDAGYLVPKDVSLANYSVFDGDADAGIDQNAAEIGRVGTLMMVSLINTYDRGIPAIPREVLVPGKWVDGSTLPTRV
jgi:DNA-binding LacI/PurR family transcriptional regulator